MAKKTFDKDSILNHYHWTQKDYVQRMSAAEWRWILLNNCDSIIYNGRTVRLKAGNLGLGVYEVYKDFVD